jgi:hypothetical protein
MTDLITPPPELVQQWASEWMQSQNVHRDNFMATRAAQWGADQELEACCEWVRQRRCLVGGSRPWITPSEVGLRAARRPKPPSLKEQALEQLDGIAAVFRMSHGGDLVCDTIRRALEALDD